MTSPPIGATAASAVSIAFAIRFSSLSALMTIETRQGCWTDWGMGWAIAFRSAGFVLGNNAGWYTDGD